MPDRYLTENRARTSSHNAYLADGTPRRVGSASSASRLGHAAPQVSTPGLLASHGLGVQPIPPLGDRGELCSSPRCLTPEPRPQNPEAPEFDASPEGVRAFARDLAVCMAEGSLEYLPRLTVDARPEYVRQLLLAYYTLVDQAVALRAEMERDREPLADRIAAANVHQAIVHGIEDCKEWLRRKARRGGHGVPLPMATAGRAS